MIRSDSRRYAKVNLGRRDARGFELAEINLDTVFNYPHFIPVHFWSEHLVSGAIYPNMTMPDYRTPNFLQGANDTAGKLADGKVTAQAIWINNAARLELNVNRYATVARVADRLKLGNFKVDGGHANGSLCLRRWVAFYGWNVWH